MSIIWSGKSSVQGATGLPILCTHPMGDIRHPLPGSCSYKYVQRVYEISLAAECSPRSGELSWASFGVIHLVYKALLHFPDLYKAYGRRTASATRDLYKYVQRVYEHSVGGRVFTPEWWIAMTISRSCTPSVRGAMGLPRFCTQPLVDL